MELKFRYVCYNKHFKEIQIEYITIDMLENPRRLPSWLFSDNCEILSRDLFTWSKDSKGEEIYDWDIVKKHCDTRYKNTWPWTCSKTPVYRNYVYEWKSPSFKRVCLQKEPKGYFESWWSNEIEIIWNIHQNKELLNNK